ncbi:MAG: glycosyltransferase [Bacteroidia bacterium]|nr:glycosyltransferase [Bacteroidia bacterium]
MKILFVIGSLELGGKERQSIELIKGLVANGFDCELLLLKNAILYPEIKEIGCQLHVLDKQSISKFKLFKEVGRVIKQVKPDIVQSWDFQSSLFVCFYTWLNKIPFVNYSIRYGKKINALSKTGLLAQITFLFSDYVLANSLTGLEAHGLKVSQKNRAIYNGYDFKRAKLNKEAEAIKRELNIEDGFVIGMVGNFLDAKDHKTIIMATQELLKSRKDITVVFIGNGSKLNEAKALIANQNSGHYRFLNNITAVEDYINIFDIHCLICNTIGHAEGISNAIMEGMAMGKPVVATDSGGNKEIVVDGKTGFIVEPFNIHQLTERLTLLLNDHSLRKSQGEAGRLRIQTEFSLDKLTHNFIELYSSIATKTDLPNLAKVTESINNRT